MSPGAPDRRRLRLAVARMAAGLVAIGALYAIVPVDPHSLGRGLAGLALVLVGGVVVVVLQLREALRAEDQFLRAVETLALALVCLIAVFALAYLAISREHASSFTEPLNRVGALYFAVSVASTVGFGDIAAHSDGARLLVITQIALDLVVFVGVARGFVHLARAGAARRGASEDEA